MTAVLPELAGLLLAAVLQSQDPFAPVFVRDDSLEITIRRDAYRVDGRRFRDAHSVVLNRQLLRGGAADHQSGFMVEYAYMVDPDTGACRLDSFFLSGEIILTYPLWTGLTEASRRDRRDWEAMFNGFQVHESGHADITLVAADIYLAELRDRVGETRADCDALEAHLNRLGEAVMDWLQGNQREYDYLSRHGQAQDQVSQWEPHDPPFRTAVSAD